MVDALLAHELPLGERPDGRLMTVHQVDRGEACDCVCPECRRIFVAHKGLIRPHHFQHKAEPGRPSGWVCGGYYETALHKLAKQVLGEIDQLWLPPQVARYRHHEDTVRRAGWVAISNVRTESQLGPIRPDAIVEAEGRDLIVEVLVSHRCTPEKLAWLREHEIPAIEIDLSGAPMMSLEIATRYIAEQAPRHWLSAPGLTEASGRLAVRIEAWILAQRERVAAAAAARDAERERQREIEEQRRQAERARWEEEDRRRASERQAEEAQRETRLQAIAREAATYYPSRTTPPPMLLNEATFSPRALVELFDGTQTVQAHLALIDQEPIRKAVGRYLSSVPEVKDAITRSWQRHHARNQ